MVIFATPPANGVGVGDGVGLGVAVGVAVSVALGDATDVVLSSLASSPPQATPATSSTTAARNENSEIVRAIFKRALSGAWIGRCPINLAQLLGMEHTSG
jgi:hypothetical protein